VLLEDQQQRQQWGLQALAVPQACRQLLLSYCAF
jgi:hypothetical protein